MRRDLRDNVDDVITAAQGSAMRPLLSPAGGQLVYGTRYEQQTGLRIHSATMMTSAKAQVRLLAQGTKLMEIQLSDGGKLALLLLCDIHKKLVTSEDDPIIDAEFLSAAIQHGHLWSLN